MAIAYCCKINLSNLKSTTLDCKKWLACDYVLSERCLKIIDHKLMTGYIEQAIYIQLLNMTAVAT